MDNQENAIQETVELLAPLTKNAKQTVSLRRWILVLFLLILVSALLMALIFAVHVLRETELIN